MDSAINTSPVCLFCGNTHTGSTAYEDTEFNNKIFKYLKCTACGLVYVHPQPNADDLEKMYPVEYQGALTTVPKGIYGSLFKHIEKTGKYRTILDYGCGGGRFTIEAILKGYAITGVEYNPALVDNLRRTFPQANFYTIDDFYNSDLTFDIIFLSNVLEHLTNPKEIIEKLKTRLNDGGIFVLEGPVENNFNLKQLTRKIIFFIRKYLFHKKAFHKPTHVLLANRKNQEQFFQDAGLETLYYVVEENNWPYPMHINDCNTMMQRVMFLIASFSVFMSKIIPAWGNNFTYIGKLRKKA